jgi:signal transduction histidine kinase
MPEIEALTQTIEGEVYRANRLIDNSRSLTRGPVHLQAVDLSEIMAAFIDTTARTPDLQDIHLEIRDLSGLSPVQADVNHLQQVIRNLVSNAADAIRARAKRESTARQRIGVRGTEVNDRVFLDIEDSGTGIPPQIQPRVFDPFFSTKRGRLGIGLSASKRLLEEQGAELSFDTGESGSTFRIAFRVA